LIKSIELTNFEGHKHSLLEFDKGLNAIIGSGDNGKSSIIRAFRWVWENKPDGDNFVSHWNRTKKGNIKGETSVVITTTNGWVKRCKTNSDNYYSINGEEFRAFGRSVPEEVSAFLNLSNINIQTQFDNHFLLSESSSEVARQLNQIVSLEKIDDSLKTGNAYIRTIKSNIKHIENDILDLTATLTSLSDIDLLDKKLTNLEELNTKADDYKNTIGKLESVVVGVESVRSSLNKFPNINIVSDTLEEIIRLDNKATATQSEVVSLSKLIDSLTEVRKNNITLKKTISSAEKSIASLPNTESLAKDIKQLDNLVSFIESTEYKIETVIKQISSLESDYKELFGDTCPLCGGAIHE
jgi:exonuclease SbcC